MLRKEVHHSLAYIREGRLAAQAGESEDENPYNTDQMRQRCAWFAGFRDERKEK